MGKRSIVWRLTLITILAAVGPALAQQPGTIAQVFEAHCDNCHGELGAYRDKIFLDRKSMVDSRRLIPGKPEQSTLFERVADKSMPPDGPRLSSDEVAAIRQWIEEGAPEWKNPAPRPFLPESDVLKLIADDLQLLPPADRPYIRYFSLVPLYNAGESKAALQAYNRSLGKLLNSLFARWYPRRPTPITLPKLLGPVSCMARIDLRRYDWDADTWNLILRGYPYALKLSAPDAARVRDETGCDVPVIRTDWFLTHASIPPLYYDILKLPHTERELESRLGISRSRYITLSPGVWHFLAGFQRSGVARNNRIVERSQSISTEWFWRTYDFASNVGAQDIFRYPLTFQESGGEIIFALPNRLNAYMIVDALGNRRDAEPLNLALNPAARDPVIRPGRSCMSCHTMGIRSFRDEIRPTTEATPATPYNRSRALLVYCPQSEMDGGRNNDRRLYAGASRACGSVPGGTDPLSVLAERMDDPLDIGRAAAELNMPRDQFAALLTDPMLRRTLGNLLTPGGTIRRDTWEAAYGAIARQLDLGVYIEPDHTYLAPTPGEFATAPAPPVEQIGFASSRDGRFNIYRMNADGSHVERVTSGAANNLAPAWSTKGSSLTFVGHPSGHGEIDIDLKPGGDPETEGSLQRPPVPKRQYCIPPVPWDRTDPTWTLDGSMIIYASQQSGRYQILRYCINPFGQNRLLTNGDGDNRQPACSPDGTQIAFASSRDGHWQIYVMGSDGTAQMHLVQSDDSDTEPTYSPDGRRIVFRRVHDNQSYLFAVDRDGTHLTQLTHGPGEDRHPAWSWDGRQIAFSRVLAGRSQIYIMNSDGAHVARVSDGKYDDEMPTWVQVRP